MNKQDFLARLEEGLSGLPQEDIAERVTFYGEMIDDRMEEGCSEEDAVAGVGPVEVIVPQIIGEIPVARIVREKVKPGRRLQAWEILLLVLGSPVWIPLLISALAVLFSLYVSIWAVVLSLWAADLSLIAGSVGALAAGIFQFVQGNALQGLVLISASLMLAGLSIFLFFGCRAASRGVLAFSRKAVLGIKTRILRKENAK